MPTDKTKQGRANRRKGHEAENEVLSIINDELGLGLKRNLSQAHESGQGDVILMRWCVEIKNWSSPQLRVFWHEAIIQASNAKKRPLLIYRKKNLPQAERWRVIMAAFELCPGLEVDYEYAKTVNLALPLFLTFVREMKL